MLRAVVDVHVGKKLATEAVFGKHTFDCAEEQGVLAGLDVLVKRFLLQAQGSGFALTAGISGVGQEDAVGPLFTCEAHLIGIDNDNEIAALNVGRIAGFVFASKDFGNFSAETAENLVGGIDHQPLMLYALCVR